MKNYFLSILLVILVAKIFRADDDEIPQETPAEKKAKHHHCYQKNYTECLNEFAKDMSSIMKEKKKENDKIDSEEMKDEFKPSQEKTYKCLNKVEAKKKKCPVGLDRCVIATFIFTDNTTLITGGCETKTPTTCFSLLKLDEYELYTGKTAKTIKCDFCEGKDCNEIKEDSKK